MLLLRAHPTVRGSTWGPLTQQQFSILSNEEISHQPGGGGAKMRCSSQPSFSGEVLEHKIHMPQGLHHKHLPPHQDERTRSINGQTAKLRNFLLFPFCKSLMGKPQSNKSHVHSQALQGKGQPVIFNRKISTCSTCPGPAKTSPPRTSVPQGKYRN